jgi:vancomycin permeability regulator SanA
MTLHTPQTAPKADAALIFGAIVRDGTISPLHKERLDAGVALLKLEKVDTLVVSNAAAAAIVMRDYLISQGIPDTNIEMDTQAIRTPDTCAEEHRKPKRTVAVISQKFHLPRIALHCKRYDLDTLFVVADSPNRPKAALLTLIRVRSRRFVREAIFTWGTLLGAYPHQPVR